MAGHILDVQFPEVNPSAPGAPGLNIPTSPGMFGAYGAEAAERLGGGVSRAADTGLDVLTARQHLTNEIHASEVNTWLADKITDRHAEFAKLEGRAALDALPQYKQDLNQLYHDSMAQAGGLQEQAMLARNGRALTTRYYGYGTMHADQQWRKWADDTSTRRAASFGQQAGIAAANGDEGGMGTFLNTSDDEVRKLYEQKGYDRETIDAQVMQNRGRNLAKIIEGRIDESPAAASAMYRKYESQMDAASSLAVRTKLRGALSTIQGRDIADEETGRALPPNAAPVADVPVSFLGAIKRFEGFRPNAYWDVKQHSIGYGTRATSPSETITREAADERFAGEIDKAAKIVDQVNPNLDPGTRAALTSLTYNSGAAWTQSGLGDKVRANDLAGARDAFLQYNKAGGVTNPGLVERRYAEAAWFGQQQAPAGGALPDKAEVFERIVARTHDNPQIQNAALARMNQIYSVYHQEATTNLAQFQQRRKDTTAEALATGTVAQPIDEADYIHNLGAVGGAKAYMDDQKNLQLGADVRATAAMSPEEITALRGRYTPQPGEGYEIAQRRAEALDKALQQNQTQLHKDAAGFMIAHTDGGIAAWGAFQHAMADPHVGPDLKAEHAAIYAAQMRALQEHAGVAPARVQVLPGNYAAQLGERWKAPQAIPSEKGAPGGAMQVLGEINSQARLWGDQWPKVYSEIAPHLDTTLRVVANGVAPTAGLALINAQQVKEPALLATMDDSTKKTFNNSVTAALTPFFTTIAGPLGDGVRTDYETAAKKLTALYMARGGDTADVGSASEQAVKDLLGFKYEFRGNLRIPKLDENDKPAPWTADQVQTGAMWVRESLARPAGVAQLAPPRFVDDGTSHAAQSAAAARAIARDGVWITDPNGERGLVLTYNREPVLRADGSALLVPWRDLSAEAVRQGQYPVPALQQPGLVLP